MQDHKTKVGEPDYTGFGVNFAIYLDPVDAETGALRVRAPSLLFPLALPLIFPAGIADGVARSFR